MPTELTVPPLPPTALVRVNTLLEILAGSEDAVEPGSPEHNELIIIFCEGVLEMLRRDRGASSVANEQCDGDEEARRSSRAVDEGMAALAGAAKALAHVAQESAVCAEAREFAGAGTDTGAREFEWQVLSYMALPNAGVIVVTCKVLEGVAQVGDPLVIHVLGQSQVQTVLRGVEWDLRKGVPKDVRRLTALLPYSKESATALASLESVLRDR